MICDAAFWQATWILLAATSLSRSKNLGSLLACKRWSLLLDFQSPSSQNVIIENYETIRIRIMDLLPS